jgi:hypothetical protein
MDYECDGKALCCGMGDRHQHTRTASSPRRPLPHPGVGGSYFHFLLTRVLHFMTPALSGFRCPWSVLPCLGVGDMAYYPCPVSPYPQPTTRVPGYPFSTFRPCYTQKQPEPSSWGLACGTIHAASHKYNITIAHCILLRCAVRALPYYLCALLPGEQQ